LGDSCGVIWFGASLLVRASLRSLVLVALAVSLLTAPSVASAALGDDVYDGFVTDAGCSGCSIGFVGSELEARIAGGADTLDTAYGFRNFGALSGRTWSRDIVRLPAGQVLAADLILFQLLDTSNRLIYQLSLASDRKLVFYSPAGGLRATAISSKLSTVTIPNDGTSSTRLEVSALRNDSVVVRVNGTDRLSITGLAGATTGNPASLRAGIVRYGGTSTNAPVTAYHRAVNISASGWLGAP
jgi:hypothetical protein